MIDRNAAIAIVRAHLLNCKIVGGGDMVLLDERTLERSFGWVCFYDSRKFVESHDDRWSVLGNGPLIVDRTDGSVHLTGTARPVEFFLERYARERGPRADAPKAP
jgi:hypothetical protein